MAPLPLMATYRAAVPARLSSTRRDGGLEGDCRRRQIVAAIGQKGRETAEVAPAGRRGTGRRERPLPGGEDVAASASGGAGIDQQHRAGRQRRRRQQALADARDQRRPAGQAHRHVGTQARGEIEQLLLRHRHPPQVEQRSQRGRGIGRAAAQAGGHRNVLGERGSRRAATRRRDPPAGAPPSARDCRVRPASAARKRPVERQATGDRPADASTVSARSTKATSELSR